MGQRYAGWHSRYQHSGYLDLQGFMPTTTYGGSVLRRGWTAGVLRSAGRKMGRGATDPEQVPQPMQNHQDDMLRRVRSDGVGEYETEHRPAEQGEPVFAAHPLACLFGMLQPGVQVRYLFAGRDRAGIWIELKPAIGRATGL
jgi:hypothetical protein